MGKPGSPKGMPVGWEAQGKKVDPTPLRLRRSRHSRPSARSSQERPCGPRAEQHPQEKTWRTSRAAHKMSGIPGEAKETLAHRKDGFTTRASVRTATASGKCLCR